MLSVFLCKPLPEVCRNKADFCEDVREQYKEMRDEFMAGLEDRKYLTIDQVRNKAYEVTSARADFVISQGMLQRKSLQLMSSDEVAYGDMTCSARGLLIRAATTKHNSMLIQSLDVPTCRC